MYLIRSLFQYIIVNIIVSTAYSKCCDFEGNIIYINQMVLEIIGSKSVEVTKKINLLNFPLLVQWGGEEFVMLLPETTIYALVLAEKLRGYISNMDIPIVGKISASFGVTEYYSGDMVDTLIHKADSLMYEAKFAGRNCVRFRQK